MATLLVVGLGNPGEQYEKTRHNAGFWVVSSIAAQHGCRLKKALFRQFKSGRIDDSRGTLAVAEPLTFMNRSGEVFPQLLRRYRVGVERTLVVCDTLDLAPGSIRLKRGGSHAGHRGLSSIVSVLGEPDFLRLYLGIGRPEQKANVKEYVLSAPDSREQLLYDSAVSKAASACERLLTEPVDAVMNELNRRQ